MSLAAGSKLGPHEVGAPLGAGGMGEAYRPREKKIWKRRCPLRRRVLALPAWFEVRTVQESQKTTFPVTLHRGEREAILLAETLHASSVTPSQSARQPAPDSSLLPDSPANDRAQRFCRA
jgi:hypothetical protein